MSKYLRVKVIPNAKSTEIVDIQNDEKHGETWRIRVQAPPEKGKANRLLIDFLAKHFKISEDNLILLRGHHSQIKFFKITSCEK